MNSDCSLIFIHCNSLVSLGPGLFIKPLKTIDDSFVVLESQARSMNRPRHRREINQGPVGEENSSAYIGVKEVRCQVPGATRGRARTKSATNNTQTSGYVRAPEGVAQCLGLPRHRIEPRGTEARLAPHTAGIYYQVRKSREPNICVF